MAWQCHCKNDFSHWMSTADMVEIWEQSYREFHTLGQIYKPILKNENHVLIQHLVDYNLRNHNPNIKLRKMPVFLRDASQVWQLWKHCWSEYWKYNMLVLNEMMSKLAPIIRNCCKSLWGTCEIYSRFLFRWPYKL